MNRLVQNTMANPCYRNSFHVDHAASLPYVLAKTNFKGRVFMTHPTKAIYKWLIQDNVRLGQVTMYTIFQPKTNFTVSGMHPRPQIRLHNYIPKQITYLHSPKSKPLTIIQRTQFLLSGSPHIQLVMSLVLQCS